MSEGLTTVVGSIVKDDPVLRFTAQGHAVCNFTVRVAGKQARDGQPKVDPEFHNVTAWRELGENVAESLFKGDRVIVRGVVKQNEWENDAGEKKTQTVLNAWNIGPDLSFSTCEVFKAERTEGRQDSGRDTTSPGSDRQVKPGASPEELVDFG